MTNKNSVQEQHLKAENTKCWLDEKHEDFYQFAILHVAWRVDMIRQPHRRLIVAWIECFPIECTYAYDLPECKKKTPSGNLYYIKFKLNISKAIEWYRDVLKNKYLTMIWQNDEKIYFNNQCNSKVLLYNNPPFPIMTITENLPYTGINWGVTKNNHIFPEKVDQDMLDIIKTKNANDWLKDRLFWDINEYLEYLGSVNFLLPNPIYSKLSGRLLPKKKGNDNEEMIVKLTMRKGQSLQPIKYYSAEKIMDEFSNLKEITPNYEYFKIGMLGYAEKSAYFIEHKDIGIIDYKPFLPFLREIKFNMRVGGTERRVKLLNGKEYTTKTYTPLSDTKVENDLLSEANFRRRLNLIRYKRSQNEAGEKFGQKILYNEHENATDLVRQIIGSAEQKVIIIDPYFAILETYAFALAATSTNIEVEIITGSDTLKKTDETSSLNNEVGSELKKHIDKIKQQDKSLKKISVTVMVGKAIFHDRFIIVDNKEVWFSGNSFNSIGKKFGAIIQLPNPNEMLEKLSQMRDEEKALIPLDVWLENRKQNKV